LSIIQRLEQLEKARQDQEAKRIVAFGRLLKSLAPEEAMALEMTLEAQLANRAVPPDIEERADIAFAKAWAAAAPEDQALLANGVLVEAR
jgi:hypothetical protein